MPTPYRGPAGDGGATVADETFSMQLRRTGDLLREISTEVRREIRPAIKKAAEPIVRDAKKNASWSSRIPKAIRVSVLKRGVEIRVSAKKAPHARVLEGITGNRTFRHPLFGNRERWFDQKTRPFLTPAVEKHLPKVRAAVIRIVDEAAVRHGYK